MKKIFYLLPFCLLALVFTACEETKEETQYDNWRARNEAFMDSLRLAEENDPNLFSVVDSRNSRSQKIYYKKIVEKTEGQKPYFTSTVKVHYKGMLIDEGVFAASTDKFYTKQYKQLTVFDQTFKGEEPTETELPYRVVIRPYYSGSTLVSVIDGWIEILQHMKVGERWEVYIPASSGYGSSPNGRIPAYSTLIFDILLEEIVDL